MATVVAESRHATDSRTKNRSDCWGRPAAVDVERWLTSSTCEARFQALQIPTVDRDIEKLGTRSHHSCRWLSDMRRRVPCRGAQRACAHIDDQKRGDIQSCSKEAAYRLHILSER